MLEIDGHSGYIDESKPMGCYGADEGTIILAHPRATGGGTSGKVKRSTNGGSRDALETTAVNVRSESQQVKRTTGATSGGKTPSANPAVNAEKSAKSDSEEPWV